MAKWGRPRLTAKRGRGSATEDAEKEGKVTIYGTVEIDEFAGWKKSFEKKYSIEVDYKREYVYGTPPPMAKKIMEDVKEGRETADAIIAADPLMVQMKDLKLLSRTKLTAASGYPKEIRQPQGYWMPLVSIPMVQAYNPEILGKKDLPRSALDLLAPEWQGSIVSHDLSLGTLGAYWVASLRPIFGEKKWRSFVEGLARNKPRLYPLYDSVVDSVSSGETKIALTVLLHDFIKAKKENRAIERLKLKDIPLMMTFNSIARTEVGKHPAAAELMLEFLLSKEGQKMVGSTYLRIPARPRVNAPYSLEKLAPKEKFTVYPNARMMKSVQDSIATLAGLFGKERKTSSSS
jgi:ABC-type Fe3+ transport system substrate-binding protein